MRCEFLLDGLLYHVFVIFSGQKLLREMLMRERTQYEQRIADLKEVNRAQAAQIATLLARLDDKLSSPKKAADIMHPVSRPAEPQFSDSELISDYQTELSQIEKHFQSIPEEAHVQKQ